jgi:hypothetical protein
MSWYGALGLVLGVFGLVVSAFFYQLDIWYTQSPQQEAEMLSKEQVALDALILLLTELPLS